MELLHILCRAVYGGNREKPHKHVSENAIYQNLHSTGVDMMPSVHCFLPFVVMPESGQTGAKNEPVFNRLAQ